MVNGGKIAKRWIVEIGVFSLVLNLLLLVMPLYLLQIYDRVLSSSSVETLVYISIIAGLSLALLGILEVVRSQYAARVAAETISSEDLDKLKSILVVCRNALSKGDSTSLRKNEILFHRIIANATQNPILILILDFIENLLEDVKRILKPDMAFSKRVIESHERIYEALNKRDPVLASREMLEDVLNVEKGLAGLSEKNE